MAAVTRRRVPIVSVPIPPLLMLCDTASDNSIHLDDAPYGEQIETLLRHISLHQTEITDAHLAERLLPADLPDDEKEDFLAYVAAGRKYFTSQGIHWK